MKFLGAAKRMVLAMMCAAVAQASSVQTKDARKIDGSVEIGDNHLTARPKDGPAVEIALSDLKKVVFVEEAGPVKFGEWKHQDVGRVHVAGAAAEVKSDAGSRYRVSGSGYGFWGARDSGHVLAWPIEGDFQIIAHVSVVPSEQTGAIAGVLFRDSLEGDSAMAATMSYPWGEVRFVRRPTVGWVGGPEGKSPPLKEDWVRLTRNGKEVASYKSKDGRFWQLVGQQEIPLAVKGLVGLGVGTPTNAYLAAAEFDHVQVISGPSGPAYFPGSVGPSSGIVMNDGSMLAGRVETIDAGKVQFLPRYAADGSAVVFDEKHPDWKRINACWMKLPVESVARVRFYGEPADIGTLIGPASSGVLLTSGDFMEAEIEKLQSHRYLDVSSIVFGVKRLDVLNEALSVVLHECKPTPGKYELRLRDGSILEGQSLRLSKDFAEIDSASMGKRKFPVSEISSIESRN